MFVADHTKSGRVSRMRGVPPALPYNSPSSATTNGLAEGSQPLTGRWCKTGKRCGALRSIRLKHPRRFSQKWTGVLLQTKMVSDGGVPFWLTGCTGQTSCADVAVFSFTIGCQPNQRSAPAIASELEEGTRRALLRRRPGLGRRGLCTKSKPNPFDASLSRYVPRVELNSNASLRDFSSCVNECDMDGFCTRLRGLTRFLCAATEYEYGDSSPFGFAQGQNDNPGA